MIMICEKKYREYIDKELYFVNIEYYLENQEFSIQVYDIELCKVIHKEYKNVIINDLLIKNPEFYEYMYLINSDCYHDLYILMLDLIK